MGEEDRTGFLFVLVGGWPGAGKSTLAAALGPRLGLPVLAKDEIKEALVEELGPRGEGVDTTTEPDILAVVADILRAAGMPE